MIEAENSTGIIISAGRPSASNGSMSEKGLRRRDQLVIAFFCVNSGRHEKAALSNKCGYG